MICINLLGGPIFILLLSSGSVAGLPHHHFRGRAPQTCPRWSAWQTSVNKIHEIHQKTIAINCLILVIGLQKFIKHSPRNTQHIFQTKRQHFIKKPLHITHMSASSSDHFLQATPTFTESGQCAAASSDKPALDSRGLKSINPAVGRYQGLGPSKTFCSQHRRSPMWEMVFQTLAFVEIFGLILWPL